MFVQEDYFHSKSLNATFSLTLEHRMSKKQTSIFHIIVLSILFILLLFMALEIRILTEENKDLNGLIGIFLYPAWMKYTFLAFVAGGIGLLVLYIKKRVRKRIVYLYLFTLCIAYFYFFIL